MLYIFQDRLIVNPEVPIYFRYIFDSKFDGRWSRDA